MKSDEAPFYLTRVECPVCKTVNEFETIKLGAYSESGRDTDFRPLNREWRNPKFQNTNPLLYFMATCSSCFYTREFNRRFREWHDDTAFRTHRQSTVRQRHLAELADDSSVIKRIGSALWSEAFPLHTAINKLLIGIRDEKLLDHPSHSDLARWYLRIAWVFRELNEASGGAPSPRVVMRHQLLRQVRDVLTGASTLCEHVADVRALLDANPEAVATTPDSANAEYASYQSELKDLAEMSMALQEKANGFSAMLSAQERGTVVGEVAGDSERYGEYPSYSAFLKSMQSCWTGVPADEDEALNFAFEHYRSAFEEGRSAPRGNAQIQLAYMVGELARRVGRFHEAQQFLNVAVRSGREWIHQLKDDPTKGALARHVVDLAIEQLHTMRDQARANA